MVARGRVQNGVVVLDNGVRLPEGQEVVLSQSLIFGQNPKIGCQEFNDLQTPKLSKKQLCDRTKMRTFETNRHCLAPS
jgi:hypothetical protein